MDILTSFNKIIIYTTEQQALFFRRKILKSRIKVSDMVIDYNQFQNDISIIRLIIMFSSESDAKEFTENTIYPIIEKALMFERNDFQIVKFLDSHIYTYSRKLQWGKKYPLEMEKTITDKILEKEKIEELRRKKILKQITKNLNA